MTFIGCLSETLCRRGIEALELINADLGNTIRRAGDDADLSGKGCIIRQYKEGRLVRIQDDLQGMKLI